MKVTTQILLSKIFARVLINYSWKKNKIHPSVYGSLPSGIGLIFINTINCMNLSKYFNFFPVTNLNQLRDYTKILRIHESAGLASV